MFSSGNKYVFECIDCGNHYEPDEVKYLCPSCSDHAPKYQPPKGVLKVLYDYQNMLKNGLDFKSFIANSFLDLLPLKNLDHWPKLKIGNTPLYHYDEGEGKQAHSLYLKDDSQNPSYSFKDRASALVSAFAKEKGYNTIIAASTGNAGSSIAAICASQQQRAIVMVPASAPKAKLMQIKMYGAKIIPVDGSYDDAFELSKQASDLYGWYNRNTAYNPMTIEGKKTVAFEILDQMNLDLPDNIFVPVGDGVIISGLYKGFEDLLKMGWIDSIPRIIAIQSKNSDNLVRNISSSTFKINAKGSIADSITVEIPRNYFMAKKYIEQYNGESLSISDEAIMKASERLSRKYGLFAEPAAATAMAAYYHFLENNKIEQGSKNLVLLTGSGLKDLKALEGNIVIPKAIKADIESIKPLLHD